MTDTWREPMGIGDDLLEPASPLELMAAPEDPETPPGKPDGDSGDDGDDGGGVQARSPATHPAVRVLVQRSRVALAMKSVPPYSNVLVVEDNPRDADRLASTLRSVFGYELKVRQCRTLGTALDAVMDDQPDLVFLDDRMGPLDRAEKSVPFLHTAGCKATIIVVSGHVDRRRRAQLLTLGVGDVIDKDELDSLSICQALINAQRGRV